MSESDAHNFFCQGTFLFKMQKIVYIMYMETYLLLMMLPEGTSKGGIKGGTNLKGGSSDQCQPQCYWLQ